MTIELYINTAERHKVDKSADLELIATLDGTLRANTDILNPSITLQLNFEPNSILEDEDGEIVEDEDGNELNSVEGNKNLLNFNYAYIPEFRRYYFVSDITTTNTGLYIVSLIVDVLYTYKDELLSLEGIVERNEFDYNELIDDSLQPFEMDDSIEYQNPVNIAPNPVEFKTEFDSGDYHIVVGIVNKDSDNRLYVPRLPGSQLPIIESEDFIIKTTEYYLLGTGSLKYLGKAIITDDTLLTYVKSVIAYPFIVSRTIWQDNEIAIGDTTITTGSYNNSKTKFYISEYLEVLRFVFPEITKFDQMSPYRHYELYIPFYGYYELDAKLLSGCTLSLYYVPNYEDGSADCFLYDITNKKMIFTAACQLGVKLGFDSTNNREVTDQRNALNLSTAVNLVGGVLSLGMGAVMGNPVAAAAGGLKIASTIASAINANAMIYDKAQVGFSSGTTSLYSPLTPCLRIRKKERLVANQDAYNHAYGKPLMQSYALNRLSGFTIFSSIHLTGIAAYKGELDELEHLLKTGVIF